MATRPLLLFFALLAATATVCVSAALGGGGGRGPLAGGWSAIKDVSDAHIQELGGWAVARHVQLTDDGLRFRRVTGGEQQVVSGMNYRLSVDATNAAGRRVPYVAEVYEQVWTNTRQLTSFKPAAGH